MPENSPKTRESLVYPEDIVLGEKFLKSLKSIHTEAQKLNRIGVIVDARTSLGFIKSWMPDTARILLIPSKPIEVDRRAKYNSKVPAPPLTEPVFLDDLQTNIFNKNGQELIITAVSLGYSEDKEPHWDHLSFDSEDHTLAIIK